MTYYVGSTTIYGSILPKRNKLAHIISVKLSKHAKHRLRVIEHYLYKTSNVSLTCRHFAISRSYFYKWYRRYNPKDLSSLEDKSRRPHRVRSTNYNYSLVKIVKKLRQDYPSYSSKKLSVILKRDWDLNYSHSTLGRVIKKYSLYFRAKIVLSKQRSKRAIEVWKKRKPFNLKLSEPRTILEFDMKHIYIGGNKQYAFVTVDIRSKRAAIHLANAPSSYQAKLALEHAMDTFGTDCVIVNDNGSENLKHAYDYLKSINVTQYFARPYTPKDKPHVENLIGKLQQECLDENRYLSTLKERQQQIQKWLNDYHFFRPHQALNYLTPAQYCDKLGITIRRVEVSTM